LCAKVGSCEFWGLPRLRSVELCGFIEGVRKTLIREGGKGRQGRRREGEGDLTGEGDLS